jgi:hypothetical protein
MSAGTRIQPIGTIADTGEATLPVGFALDRPVRFVERVGGSSRRYAFAAFSIFECPAFGNAAYIIQRRSANGEPEVVEIGSLTSRAPSLNLAYLRHQAATFGAREIELHLLPDGEEGAKAVARDIAAHQAALVRPAAG